jgi:membrane protease YdiL (CAAX protease family)
MLFAIHWQAQNLIRFAIGVLLCLASGILVSALVRAPELGLRTTNADFLAFAAGTVFLHGGTLVAASQLLRWQGVRWRSFLGLANPRWPRHVLLGLCAGLAAVPALLLMNKLCYHGLKALGQEPVQQITVQILQDLQGWLRRACFGISAIVLAPVAEEIIFRGVLYPALRQRGHPHVALVASSLLFAFIHSNVMTFVPLFVFALTLVWLAERTDGLVASITAHAVFNSVNFILLLNEEKLTRFLKDLGERI